MAKQSAQKQRATAAAISEVIPGDLTCHKASTQLTQLPSGTPANCDTQLPRLLQLSPLQSYPAAVQN